MRGSGLLFGLVLAALAAPATGVGSAETPDAPTADPDGAALRWLVPSHGFEGHPVHAAVGVFDGDQLVPDQDLRVTILSDDGNGERIVFFSQSIHEDDGFHSLVWTPRQEGNLILRADFAFDATGATEASATIPIRESPVSDRVPYEPFHLEPSFQGDVEEGHLAVWGKHHGIEHQALIDLQDGDGRLLASHWPHANGAHVSHAATPIGGFGSGLVRALVTSHPQDALTVFTETLTFDLDQPHQPAVRQPYVATYDDTCADAGIPVVTEPASLTPAGLTWHTDMDIRVAIATDRYLDDGYRPTEGGTLSPTAAMYHVFGNDPSAHVTGGGDPHRMTATAADPFREVIFRIRDPGVYLLDVRDDLFDEDERRHCGVYFHVVANAADDAGEIEHDIEVRDQRAVIEFQVPVYGTPLWHYAYDTRVIKLHTDDEPGRLVWKGKLHGVVGHVAFELAELDPGTYEVRTYPSPQEFGKSAVSAPTKEGFTYRFQVAAPEAEPVITEVDAEPEAVPAVGPLAALVVLFALAVRLRHR